MPEVLLALGSNVGDRLGNLQAAVDALSERVEILAASGVYETAPMYVLDQQAFLNAAVKGRTDLPPLALLKLLKETENQIGRRQGRRFGPREIDIDLISYGALIYRYRGKDRQLTVPHEKVRERRFVLQPLFDVDPEGALPGMGPIRELLTRTSEQSEDVQRIEHAVLSVHRHR